MQQHVGILTLPSEKDFSGSLSMYVQHAKALFCVQHVHSLWDAFIIRQDSSNFNGFSLCCIDMVFRIKFSFQQAAGAVCCLSSFVEYVPSKSTHVSEE